MTRQYGKITKYQLSKSLIDEIIASGGAGGGTPLVSIKKFSKTITSSVNKIEIGSLYFSKETDQLLVFVNSVYLEDKLDYKINEDNTISKADGSDWIASEKEPCTFNFVCIMNIPDEEVELDGKKIVDGTISEEKLDEDLKRKINEAKRIDTYATSNNDIEEGEWSEGSNGLYTATLTHNLNSEDLMVTVIDKKTKKNLMFSCESKNANTIELELAEKANVRVLVVDTNSSTFGELIDDDGQHTNKTLSSKKIYETFALKGEVAPGEADKGTVFKTNVTESSWSEDGKMFKCKITHNMNTKDIVDVTGYNKGNNKLLFAVKLLDNNSIEILSDAKHECTVLVVGAIELETTGPVDVNVDATNVTFSKEGFTAKNVADALVESKGKIDKVESSIQEANSKIEELGKFTDDELEATTVKDAIVELKNIFKDTLNTVTAEITKLKGLL